MLFIRLPTASVLLGVTATTLLAGCFSFPELVAPAEPPHSLPPAPPRVKPDLQPTTELRIPGDPVAKVDIPVVPVPPIPLGQGAAPRITTPTTQPEIQRVSTLPPTTRPTGVGERPAPTTPLPTPPVIATMPPVPAPPSAQEPSNPKQVVQQANDAYAHLDGYIARLTRREQINGKNKPEEVMLFKFRKQPWSVYFKWLGAEGHDREVVYVKGQYEDKIHTLLAAGDMPLMSAGKHMALSPDSILVKSACRYPITEAGLGATIARITALSAALERGNTNGGKLTDLGVKTRDDYHDGTLRLLEQQIPAHVEPEMPGGGRRLYGFDTKSHLPVLLVCFDEKEQEVEYYRYDRVIPAKLDDADFNPDKMGAASQKMVKKP